jgi:hypothetical protein
VPPTARRWPDSLALAAASLALYLALAQEAFHGLDVHVHVYFLTQGHLEHPLHLLYLKIVGSLWPPLRGLGLSPHHALRLLAAVGTAAGVLLCHRAALCLGLPRARAAAVAGLTAVVPAAVFFATVAEIHGVFTAFAGAAWWAWARFATRPTVASGIWMGVTTALAASVHATGHLLVVLLGLCALAWRGGRGGAEADGPARSPWAGLAAALATHLVVAVAIAVALQPSRLSIPFAGQIAYLGDTAGKHQAWTLPALGRVLGNEWLIALFPLSLTGLVALGSRPALRLALATALALLTYLAVSVVLLPDLNERGAYLLPLAFALALVTAQMLRPGWLAVLGAAALAAAVIQVRLHDRVHAAPWLPGFLAVAREQPVAVICRDVAEQEAITRALPDVPFVRADSLLASADRAEDYPTFCATFDAMFAHYQRSGRVVLITRSAYEALLATGMEFFARFLGDHLPRHYRLDEVSRDGFVALLVRG